MNDERTKICSKCKLEKPRSEFYARTNRPNGVQSRCKKCANGERWINGRFKDDDHKALIYSANKKSYERHKESYKTRANRRNAQCKINALEAHGSVSCQRCGFDKHPAALEFHHRDPSQKLFNVSTAVTCPDKYEWEIILRELEKCDVVCANCHKIEHCTRSYEGIWKNDQFA